MSGPVYLNHIELSQGQDILHMLYSGDRILFSPDSGRFLFRENELSTVNLVPGEGKYVVGLYDRIPCLASWVEGEPVIPESLCWKSLYGLLGRVPDADFNWVGRGWQLINSYRNHRFCSRCGSENRPQEKVHGSVCDNCGLLSYPRISPAVIMLVTRGEECLMAKNVQWADTDMYSALAGFVEPGEYAEQTVHRETMEEVGLTLSSVEYIGSQPWPFPGQLMLGFLAEYKSGELSIDTEEIAEAIWCRYDRLPPRPDQRTLSGRVIDTFVNRCRLRLGE